MLGFLRSFVVVAVLAAVTTGCAPRFDITILDAMTGEPVEGERFRASSNRYFLDLIGKHWSTGRTDSAGQRVVRIDPGGGDKFVVLLSPKPDVEFSHTFELPGDREPSLLIAGPLEFVGVRQSIFGSSGGRRVGQAPSPYEVHVTLLEDVQRPRVVWP